MSLLKAVSVLGFIISTSRYHLFINISNVTMVLTLGQNNYIITAEVSLIMGEKVTHWNLCFIYEQFIFMNMNWYETEDNATDTIYVMHRKLLLTHWGRVMQLCISKLTILGSDNGLLPGCHQTITWTNAGIVLIGPLGTNFNEILIEIHTFLSKKMLLKMSYENVGH